MSRAQGKHIAEQITRIINGNADNEANFEQKMAAAIAKAIGKPMPKLSIAECHVIEAIGSRPEITAAQISESLNMTRGGVSKIIKRLETKGYLFTAPKERNKKEISLELTSAGEVAHEAHEKLHREKVNKLTRILSAYTDEELDIAIRLLQDFIDFEGL